MSNIKKYYWIISLLGGFVSLFGFFTPTWYSPPVWIEHVWMIGLIHHVTGGNVVEIAPTEMFIPSIIATVLISLCLVLIILSALLKKKDKRLLGNAENFWIMLAILEISASIYYIIGIQHGFYLHTNLNFWDIYEIRKMVRLSRLLVVASL